MSVATQPDRAPLARLETGHRRPEDPAPLGREAGVEEPMIALRGLTKRYGHATVVDELSFDVRAGTVVGFLGRNGAGKSTTLKILAGLLSPTSGTATIGGVPYRSLRRPMKVAGSARLGRRAARGVPLLPRARRRRRDRRPDRSDA